MRIRKILAGTVAGALVAVWSVPALANPTGGTVVAGSAKISSAPGALTVHQTSNRAIINWQNFSIGKGQLTQFLQPSVGSANATSGPTLLDYLAAMMAVGSGS